MNTFGLTASCILNLYKHDFGSSEFSLKYFLHLLRHSIFNESLKLLQTFLHNAQCFMYLSILSLQVKPICLMFRFLAIVSQNSGISPRMFKHILFHEEVLGGGCLLHYSISGKCIDELKSRNFPIYEYFSREQYRTEDALLHLRFALCLKDLLVFFNFSVQFNEKWKWLQGGLGR